MAQLMTGIKKGQAQAQSGQSYVRLVKNKFIYNKKSERLKTTYSVPRNQLSLNYR